eukprot:2445600-Prymnesium_polylepis.1
MRHALPLRQITNHPHGKRFQMVQMPHLRTDSTHPPPRKWLSSDSAEMTLELKITVWNWPATEWNHSLYLLKVQCRTASTHDREREATSCL